jgi:hypothetical protein
MGPETPFKTPTARYKREDDGCRSETWHQRASPAIRQIRVLPTAPARGKRLDHIWFIERIYKEFTLYRAPSSFVQNS